MSLKDDDMFDELSMFILPQCNCSDEEMLRWARICFEWAESAQEMLRVRLGLSDEVCVKDICDEVFENTN
jgi:hypothetical protein